MFCDYRSKETQEETDSEREETDSESESVMFTRSPSKQKVVLESEECTVGAKGNLKSATKEKSTKWPTHSETEVNRPASSQTSPSMSSPTRRTETTPQKGIGKEIEESAHSENEGKQSAHSGTEENQSGGTSASKAQTRRPNPGKGSGKEMEDNKSITNEVNNKSRHKSPKYSEISSGKSAKRPRRKTTTNKSKRQKLVKKGDGEETQISEKQQTSEKERLTIPTTKPKRVSTQNPIHQCPSECGYGLCHRCWGLKLAGNDDDDTQKKGGTRRGRRSEIACPDIHEQMYMLNELPDQAYFYKSYVDKKTKADTYKFPRTCDYCKSSLIIDGK
jgi:hypothetical protein